MLYSIIFYIFIIVETYFSLITIISIYMKLCDHQPENATEPRNIDFFCWDLRSRATVLAFRGLQWVSQP